MSRPPGLRRHGVVDVHAHALTRTYVEAARAAGHDHPDGMPGWPSWDAREQLADMDRRDIARAVLSISSPGVHFGDDDAAAALATAVNDEVAEVVAAHPDRLGFFAALPLPDVAASAAEAERALGDLGAAGVVLESNAHGQYLGDPALEPLWDALEAAAAADGGARDAVVLLHPTSPPGWEATALGRPRPMLEFLFDSTRSIVDLVLSGVLARHPHLQVVVPHSGAALAVMSDRIATFQGGTGGEGLWDAALRRLWFDTAGTPFPTALPVLTGLVGTGRIVYGSDSCWTPAAAVDAQMASIDAAAGPTVGQDWWQLTTANARRLLG